MSTQQGRNHSYIYVAGVAATTLLLAACGSGESFSGGGETPSTDLTGIFIDSPVEGLEYETATYSGITNAAGEFNYANRETITFSIGELVFPSTQAKELITPLDLVGTDDPANPIVLNIARLLQTLDEDGNVANGITIPAAAAEIATPLDFTVSAAEFEVASANLVANAGGSRTSLISEEAALNNLLIALLQAAVTNGTALSGGIDDNQVNYLTAVTRRSDGNYTRVSNKTIGLEYDQELNSYQAAINTGTWELTGDQLCSTTKSGNTSCVWMTVDGNQVLSYSDISKTELITTDTIAERFSTTTLPGRYTDARCGTCYIEFFADRTGQWEENGVLEDFTWRTDQDGNLRLDTFDDAPIPRSERMYIEASTGEDTYDTLDVVVYIKSDDSFPKMFESVLTLVPEVAP